MMFITLLLNFGKNKERDGHVTHIEFEKLANFSDSKCVIGPSLFLLLSKLKKMVRSIIDYKIYEY